MDDTAGRQPTSHLVIAGTGRAGTSFLVRYLTELGLDTTLSRRGEAQAGWDEAANAGLEERLAGNGDFPYVVKSPWAGEYIEQILASPHITVDALVVPVRDLVEAATSRAILEMRSIHQNAPWMAEMDRSWEVWGSAPGGVVYSLNPLDQARLLAVGFHNLVWRATEADIPVYFLAFPRFVEDKEYLFRVLRPFLSDVTPERAYKAHARIADGAQVRVGAEIAGAAAYKAAELPLPGEVDMLALRRELVRLRANLHRSAQEAKTANENARLATEEVKLAKDETRRLAAEAAELRAAVATERAHAQQSGKVLAELRGSRIWRSTAPIRALLTAIKRVGR